MPVIALVELRLGVTMRQRRRFRQNFLAPLELVSNKCPPPQNIFAGRVYDPRFELMLKLILTKRERNGRVLAVQKVEDFGEGTKQGPN